MRREASVAVATEDLTSRVDSSSISLSIVPVLVPAEALLARQIAALRGASSAAAVAFASMKARAWARIGFSGGSPLTSGEVIELVVPPLPFRAVVVSSSATG